jgi:hypothetical protein
VKSGTGKRRVQVELWLLAIMIALAIAGVGVTQVVHSGGRFYWLFLLLTYAGIGLVVTWQRHAKDGQSLWPVVRAQVLHWLGTFVAINIVLFFESVDIASRGAAADDSLLMLALSCFLAGVHILWAYMPVAIVLAVMAVGLGYLDQISLYLLVIPSAILTVWVFAKYKLRQTAGT